MIQQIDIGHDHVLAFRVEGKLDAEDMKAQQQLLKPELESAAPFSLYLELAATEGVEPTAVAERLRFIFSNVGKVLDTVKKVALVTDKQWLQYLAAGVFSLVPPIEQKSFSFEQKEEARRWVAAQD